jgi:hypothetical protein
MASASTATRSAEQAGGRRRGLRWLIVLAVAALAWAALAPPPAPAGGSRLSAFAPETLASLEQEAWEAYYYRQWPRLFWLLLQVMRSQFGLSWAQSVYGAYLNTRAQVIFARQGDLGGEAQAYMRQFYALVREPLGASYDVDRAAAAELNWWVVHRRRHEYADYTELVKAMAALYQEVYGVPADKLQAALGRVRAVDASDQWLAQQMPPGSPLLAQVREELLAGYTALKAAIQEQRAMSNEQ